MGQAKKKARRKQVARTGRVHQIFNRMRINGMGFFTRNGQRALFAAGDNAQTAVLAEGINGRFKGTIKALGKVAVTKEADFNGEIKAKSFSVEDGAYFKGVVELDREPHKKPTPAETLKKPIPPETVKQSVTPPSGVKMEK